jgi:hypothetical protein
MTPAILQQTYEASVNAHNEWAKAYWVGSEARVTALRAEADRALNALNEARLALANNR